MRRHATTVICAAIVGPALAAVLTGCGHAATSASASAGPSATAGTESSPQASARASAGSTGSVSPTVSPASPSPTVSPDSLGRTGSAGSPGPTGSANSSHGTTPLADGLYVDAPDGQPHYVLALARNRSGAVSGSISYLYQDGRISTIGKYTGMLASNGRLTITIGGRTLTGTYQSTQFTLASCTRALRWATQQGDCGFTYHGHVP